MTANLIIPETLSNWLVTFVIIGPAILLAVTFHEFAHGAAAYLLGDDTAKRLGRLSLNPLRHLDPIGTLMFIIFHFGWGKPVPIDQQRFANPRWGMALTGLAGPLTNFALAAVFALFLRFGLVDGLLKALILAVVQINIVLGVFNLFPIPPLDGSRLVSALLPPFLLVHYEAFEGYGIAVLFALIYFYPGGLWRVFGPVVGFFERLLLV